MQMAHCFQVSSISICNLKHIQSFLGRYKLYHLRIVFNSFLPCVFLLPFSGLQYLSYKGVAARDCSLRQEKSSCFLSFTK